MLVRHSAGVSAYELLSCGWTLRSLAWCRQTIRNAPESVDFECTALSSGTAVSSRLMHDVTRWLSRIVRCRSGGSALPVSPRRELCEIRVPLSPEVGGGARGSSGPLNLAVSLRNRLQREAEARSPQKLARALIYAPRISHPAR